MKPYANSLTFQEKLSTLEQKIISTKAEALTHNELTAIKLEFAKLRKLYAQQKTCCDKPAVPPNAQDMNIRIEELVASYFGTGAFKSEIARLVEEAVRSQTPSDSQVSDQSAPVDCPQVSEQVSIPDDYIRSIVKEVLKIYDADKTGRVDYALESAGGQIISIRCTQRHNVNTRAYKVLGFTLYYESGDPRTVIQGHQLQPGEREFFRRQMTNYDLNCNIFFIISLRVCLVLPICFHPNYAVLMTIL